LFSTVFQEESLNNQEKLLAEVADLKKLFKQVIGSNKNSVPASTTIWPLKSEDDLSNAENLIKDPRAFWNEVFNEKFCSNSDHIF